MYIDLDLFNSIIPTLNSHGDATGNTCKLFVPSGATRCEGCPLFDTSITRCKCNVNFLKYRQFLSTYYPELCI